ncbi:phosphoglycerate kinase [Aureococcus anophagefferens]|nr:phosphoglycerate kinase [Aureococcus anophagefferens]
MSLPSSSMMDALTSLWSVDFDLTHSVVALKLARAAFQQPNAPRPVDATAEASATAFAAEAATGRLFPRFSAEVAAKILGFVGWRASSASADGPRRAGPPPATPSPCPACARPRASRRAPRSGRRSRSAPTTRSAAAGDGVACDFPRLEDMSRESGSLWRNLLSRLRYVACAARTAPAAPALFVVEILAQDWRDSPADPDHVVASSAARVLGAWATDAFDDDKSFIAGTPGAYYWGRLHVATDGCAPVSRSALWGSYLDLFARVWAWSPCGAVAVVAVRRLGLPGGPASRDAFVPMHPLPDADRPPDDAEWPVVAHVASTFADDGDAMRVASLTFAFTGCRRGGADDQAFLGDKLARVAIWTPAFAGGS